MSKKLDDLKAKFVAMADQTGDGKINLEDAQKILREGSAAFTDDWIENLVWCALAIVSWECAWMVAGLGK